MSLQVGKRVEGALARLAGLCFRRPWLTLLLVFAVTAAGASATLGHLTLNADLVELLPHSFASVRDLEVLKKRFGGIGYAVVVGQGAAPKVLERFARDLAPKLQALPTVRYVDYRRPIHFFEDRALYFLDTADLQQLRDAIVARVRWEKQHHNPLYVDLEHTKPPSLGLDALKHEYAGRGQTSWVQTQMGEAYYLDRQKKIIALLCKPASLSTNIDFARKLLHEIRGVVAKVDLSKYPGLHVAYAGNYTKKVDQHDMIMRDLTLATWVAALLILLYVAWHFRRIAAIAMIIGPLAVGLIWVHTFAAAAFGSLNILTGFIGAILLGLGIDYGIHLLGRYEAELAAGHSFEATVRAAFGDTGRAVAVSALTTTVGFAGLGLSEFRAFREFGVIAAVGMVLVMCAYLICLPAGLAIASRWGWKPYVRRVPPDTLWSRWAVQHGGKILVACALLLVPAIEGFHAVRFNYNFRALVASNLPSFRMDHLVDGLLGYSQTPVVVLTDRHAEERRVAAALRAREKSFGRRSTIDFVASGTDLVPPDQQAKWKILQSLRPTIAGLNPDWLPSRLRRPFALLQRATRSPPFTAADWPPEVRRQFRGPDGTADEGFVLVFPAVDLSDGAKVSAFAKQLRGITLPSGRHVAVAGEPMVLADIFDMVVREAPEVLSVTLVLIFATMWLLLGSLRQALLCMVPAALTLVGTFALLPAVHLDLNYINIVMVPVLFGIGVDGGVHLVMRVAQEGHVSAALTETGRAICGAILTTALGFGALLLADHKGLDSLGELAVLGLAMNLLACLVVLPALLGWRPGWAVPHEEPRCEGPIYEEQN